jgi:hypothetical protein
MLRQDFDASVARNIAIEGDSLQLGFGLKYQYIDAGDGLRLLTQITYPLNTTDPVGSGVSSAPPNSTANDGRTRLGALGAGGAYLVGKYAFPKANALHAGVRGDYNGVTDNAYATFRGGYVGTLGDVTAKILYGQAVASPSTYDVSRAITTLVEERSQTLEANAQWTIAKLVVLSADLHDVIFSKPIVFAKAVSAGFVNGDSRTIIGADLGARLLLRPFQVWAYYSRIFKAEQTDEGSNAIIPIGDIAIDKVWAGASYDRGPLTATVLGRWIGPRTTVPTNPVGTVASFLSLDANVTLSHVGVDGLWFGLHVRNMLDSQYFHPGTNTAGSGSVPGAFSGSTYTGSQDIFNSLLPQPRRSFFLTMGLDL